ncbi:MAG: DarT ssDNA thymidine ADP-ribosyltransferase family protein [Pseudolysinimonas sp.]
MRHAGGRAAGTAALPTVTLAEQRIFHVTHEQNLAAILATGALQAGVVPVVDVSSAMTRELRASVDVVDGATVADYVPFYLSPDASRWDELRSGAVGTHWSDAARATKPLDYVILVSTAGALGPDVVVTDRDAADSTSRFGIGTDGGAPLIRRLRSEDPEFFEPEILAPVSVPFEAITLIGVPNDRVRDRVKRLLTDAGGHAPKVSVFPPWFQPTE